MTRQCRTILLASLIVIGWQSTHSARHADAEPPAPAPVAMETETEEVATFTRRTYYGWQIALLEAASVTAASWSWQKDDDVGLSLVVGAYVASGPLVHLSHGNWERALISGGLRVGLPGLAIAATNTWLDDDFLGGLVAVPLFLGSVGLATGIDWLVLGWATEEVPLRSRPASVPQVSAGPDGGFQVGVLGRF